jgi:small-conductance mechanosensitive channel
MILFVAATAQAAAFADAPEPQNQQQILQFLNQVIDWYQRQSVERLALTRPSDIAFANENQPTADQIVHQSFDFARAQAETLRTGTAQTPKDSRFQTLSQTQASLIARSGQEHTQLEILQRQLDTAPRNKRAAVQSEIAKMQSEVASSQARLETIKSILGIAGGDADPDTLLSHIAALEHSLPAGVATGHATNAPAPLTPTPGNAASTIGVWGAIRETVHLSSNLRDVSDMMRRTEALSQNVKQMQGPLMSELRDMSRQSDQIMSAPDPQDPALVAQQKAQLDALTARFHQVAATMLPLSKESSLLDIYRKNLQDWYNVTKSDYTASVKSMTIRLVILAAFLAAIFGAFELWRRAIVRYSQDYRRRYQLLLLRKIALWIVISLIVLFSLTREFGSLATFAGLMTAGVAVALQNVILAVVGYFSLIGKFGVKVGDRVQVENVIGKVVEIGLIRLQIMELVGTGIDAQPTGRIVAFSNSIVFQPTTGLFRQVPGASFVWRETTFTLAADSDYHAVEVRLLGAVESAFEDYKAEFAQLGRQMQETLGSIPVGPLAPKLRFRLTAAGLEVILRFPVKAEMAEEIDDHVTRELLRAIETEPKLKIVAADIPAIRLKTRKTTETASQAI